MVHPYAMGKGENNCAGGEILGDFWTGRPADNPTTKAFSPPLESIAAELSEASPGNDPPGVAGLDAVRRHLTSLKLSGALTTPGPRTRLAGLLSEHYCNELDGIDRDPFLGHITDEKRQQIKNLYEDILADQQGLSRLLQEENRRTIPAVPEVFLYYGALERLGINAALQHKRLPLTASSSGLAGLYQDVHETFIGLSQVPERERGRNWQVSFTQTFNTLISSNDLLPRKAAFYHVLSGYDPHVTEGDDGQLHMHPAYRPRLAIKSAPRCAEAERVYLEGQRSNMERWCPGVVHGLYIKQRCCPACFNQVEAYDLAARQASSLERQDPFTKGPTYRKTLQRKVQAFYDGQEDVDDASSLTDLLFSHPLDVDHLYRNNPAGREALFAESILKQAGPIFKGSLVRAEQCGIMGADDPEPVTHSELLLGPSHDELMGDKRRNLPFTDSKKLGICLKEIRSIADWASREFWEVKDGTRIPSMTGAGRKVASESLAELFQTFGVEPD